jgi:amino acid permease
VSGGDIAGLISAGIFAVLVALLAVPLLKLGRVFDETSDTIREVRENATPILTELSSTLTEANKQLVRVDAITSSVEEATANLTSLVALFSATLGGPLIKIAGFSAGVRAAITGARPKKGRAPAKK